jgi:ankyrin repeat protein
MIGRIFVSVRKGEIANIEDFLDRGGDVNAYDKVSSCEEKRGVNEYSRFIISQINYCTLLDHACSTGNIEIAKLLLNRGAKIMQNKVRKILILNLD